MGSIQKRYRSARALVTGWTSDQLKRNVEANSDMTKLLDVLGLTDVNSIAISTAEFTQIETVTGFKLRDVCWKTQPKTTWEIWDENQFPIFDVSAAFLEQHRRFNNFLVNPNCEALARSKIDIFITEALEALPTGRAPLKLFGEGTFRQHHVPSGLTLNGDGDYCLVYGEEGRMVAANVSLIIEAKSATTGLAYNQLKQLFTYMAIAFNARKAAKKENVGVFGILTNGENWVFLRIDNAGAVTKSGQFLGEPSKVLRHIAFVLAAAQSNSPSTSCYSSAEELNTSAHVTWSNPNNDTEEVENIELELKDEDLEAEE